jgi:L-ascorbate metabolism protein UlaG (beta-lactamase superfamily)
VIRIRSALAALTASLVLGSGLLLAQEKKEDVTVRWYGQACFELDFPGGLVVLCDPFDAAKIGTYAFPKHVKPDVVTISHEHFDHNNSAEVTGEPLVLRGLTSADMKAQDWHDHDVLKKGVRIRSVRCFHDEDEGRKRGKNTIFVFEPETNGAFGTIAHLGDLGHKLTDEQLAKIGPVDAVLVPVGGGFTIDAKAAKAVCDQLKPRAIIVPMHYKTPALKKELPLATADDFLALYGDRVTRATGNETKVATTDKGPVVVVLGYTTDALKKEDGMAVKKKDETGANVAISEAKAWVNAQPGARAKELNVTFTIEVASGAGDATLTAIATLVAKGAKPNAVSLEDENGSPFPASGVAIAKGAKKRIVCHAVSGQASLPEATVEIQVSLRRDGGGEVASDTASARIQDVR